MSRKPAVLAVPLALFGAVSRLLPRRFRETWFAEAGRDLERALTEVLVSRGRAAAWVAGLRAVADAAARVPVEWWAARSGRGKRDARGFGPEPMEATMIWMKELAQAARALARMPGFTSSAAVTLALGIGANVAIFAVVNTVLLRPLPYPDADRIVSIRHHAPGLDLDELESSEGMLSFYAQEADFFEALAAFRSTERNLVGGPNPERVELTTATPEIFDVLRVQPAIGRPFSAADVREGAPPVVLLTDAAWRSRFGADPDVIGRTLRVDDVVTEVVGVMPRGFAFPDPDAVGLVPLRIDPEGPFGTFGTRAIGRLADGLTVEGAARRARDLQARVPDFFPDLEQEFLDRAGWTVTLERYQDRVIGDEVASALWIVLGTVGVVLLIACANVANLFLVRAESRQKELAVRAAMGAGWVRIARGFLSEALLLGLSGGVAGLLLAWGGVRLLAGHGPSTLPRLHELNLDTTTLSFAALISVLTALVLGAFPLVRYSGGALALTLREGGRGATDGRGRHRTRNVLVAAQLAMALVLLVGSGLMLRTFQALRTIDPGFDGTDVTAVGLSLGEGVDNASAALFYAQVADEVAALPGVTSVGLTSLVPLSEGSANGGSFHIEGVPRAEDELPPVAMYKVVSGAYLDAMRQPLLEGRALTHADWQPGAEPVMLVNESFRDRLLEGQALGKGISWDEGGSFARIVGVVGDTREREIREDPGPWGYLPLVVGDWGYPNLDRSYLVVRGAPGMALPLDAIRRIVARLGPSVPITSVLPMDEVVGRAIAGTSFTVVLVGIAAGVALFLGAVGLFGVISYVVSQRTREIGVRVALGARAGDIREMVFRQGARVAAAGVLLGLLGALALTRLMTTLLYDVSATDPWSFVIAPLVLALVAVTATWLPARRAARVDPVVALRSE